MSCGRAVLLADEVNIAPEIAADGAGLMVPDTQQGTDDLVRDWIEMPIPQREAMGERALEVFYARYDMRTGAAAIFHLFDDFAPKAGSR